MERTDLQIKIIRKKQSHDYKFDKALNNYQNNSKNNLLDSLILLKDGKEIFQSNVQTVANHPLYDYKDTILNGSFQMKAFVVKQSYQEEIHGIINARDLDNQLINGYSMQNDNGTNKGRWLFHSTLWKGSDLKNAYSAGCFIFPTSNTLKEFNIVLRQNRVVENDVINGYLTEV